MEKTISLIYHGQPTRIDKFLAGQCSPIPRNAIKTAILSGQVFVNGSSVDPDYQLKTGDRIEAQIKPEEKTVDLQPDPTVEFKIIFSNDSFAVINKPAGLTVHPSATQKSNTLVNGLLARFPQIAAVGEDRLRPGIVHRLDKDTSGLMVVALTQESFLHFKSLFQQRQIEKRYLALVWGELKSATGTIRSFIGRSKANPLKQASNIDPERISNPKEAVTDYLLVGQSNGMSLVEAKPKTGRMHQIRIHFHSIGHPLVGDKKYFNKATKEKNSAFPHHFLHAFSLRFVGPDGQDYAFTSDLPVDEWPKILENFPTD